ncbi:MAG TPA: 30S ribosome-binding factor RbfA [Burkholderiales bacterium]|jgi:ribosome-binding factor A|nr:30S ribosome-binding factor RbfA [Burkholderiales bacterium]
MANQSARRGRIADQLQRDLAELIRTEINDPRIGMLTITGVELSRDQRCAKVFFTVLGEEAQVALAQEGLQRASGFLRSRLAAALRLRVMPELHFTYDASVAQGARLSRLIDEAVGKSRKDKRRRGR